MSAMWKAIQNAFSSSSLAAMRNVLTALAAFIGALGIAGLTQSSLQVLVDRVMAVGTAFALLITAVAALVAAAMPMVAAFKASTTQRAKSVAADVTAEQGKPVAQQVATVTVADAIGDRTDVKLTMNDPALAEAVPSPRVTAAK